MPDSGVVVDGEGTPDAGGQEVRDGILEMDARRLAGKPEFVLDLAENPHPRLLSEALYYRSIQWDSPTAAALWHGYLLAMCGATGWPIETALAWLDSHADEAPAPSPLGVPVEIRR